MKCPKPGCDGAMYRFRPKHLVAACYRAGTDVLIRFDEPGWAQVGLMCGTCGYMEFYAQDPRATLAQGEHLFELTEPVATGGTPEGRGSAGKEATS